MWSPEAPSHIIQTDQGESQPPSSNATVPQRVARSQSPNGDFGFWKEPGCGPAHSPQPCVPGGDTESPGGGADRPGDDAEPRHVCSSTRPGAAAAARDVFPRVTHAAGRLQTPGRCIQPDPVVVCERRDGRTSATVSPGPALGSSRPRREDPAPRLLCSVRRAPAPRHPARPFAGCPGPGPLAGCARPPRRLRALQWTRRARQPGDPSGGHVPTLRSPSPPSWSLLITGATAQRSGPISVPGPRVTWPKSGHSGSRARLLCWPRCPGGQEGPLQRGRPRLTCRPQS